jgi:hypothetical protein
MSEPKFRVVQPWGRDKVKQSTEISRHHTADEAFAAVTALTARMVRTGAPSDAVELIVVDHEGRILSSDFIRNPAPSTERMDRISETRATIRQQACDGAPDRGDPPA